MTEELRRFGSDARLCGILTLPPDAPVSQHAVLFITAGLLHKPGPYRLHVDLARQLAGIGLPVLRFDLSGIGESGQRSGGQNAEQAAVADVREAMDMIAEELGIRRFVLAGLCSGAEVAHRTAVADARVAGVVAMDGYIPRTRAFYAWHYLPRVFSLAKWTDYARGLLRRLTGRGRRRTESAEDLALQFWSSAPPDRDRLAGEFRTLCARQVRQLQVFSGGSGDCSYPGQFHDAFSDVDFKDLLDVRFIADADHMYVLHADRSRLMRAITQWTSEYFMPHHLSPPARQDMRVRPGHGLAQAACLAGPERTQPSAKLAGRRNTE